MMLHGKICLGLFMIIKGASAATDWEFISCPVIESFPGFKYKNISALGVAALANASEDVGTFLDNGCDPNFSDTYLTYIDTECVNPIFKKLGISCARQLKVEGYTPLILAVLHGTAETVKKLAQVPDIDLDAQTSSSYSPLWLAANEGNFDMVKILAEAGADLEIAGGDYLTTSLGESVLSGNTDLVRYLIAKGANVNIRSSTGSSPASYAVTNGNVEMLSMLQKAGADLDAVEGAENTTLLTIAAAANKLDVVDFLISQKVDLNRLDLTGKNALGFAAVLGYLDILQSLARAGAHLNILLDQDLSALYLAILRDNTDVALFLIKNGANVDFKSASGFTPSHVAAQKGNLSALKALAAAGSDLEVSGGLFEMTPLALAAVRGQLEIAQFLKEEGVNLDAEDTDGKTALDLASEAGYDDIVKLLEEK